jgi:NAD-dependent dihydropyrimidine dehydrogenase PreA subunit
MSIKVYEAEVVIKIDTDKCKGGGECVEVCPSGVYEIIEEKAVASKVEDCIQCCLCVENCPTGAIDHSACK